jgi:hypothetical protein
MRPIAGMLEAVAERRKRAPAKRSMIRIPVTAAAFDAISAMPARLNRLRARPCAGISTGIRRRDVDSGNNSTPSVDVNDRRDPI